MHVEMQQHEQNGTFGPPQSLPLGFRATPTRYFIQNKDRDKKESRTVQGTTTKSK